MRLWKNSVVVLAALAFASCGDNSTSDAAVTGVSATDTSLTVGEVSTVSIDFEVASSIGTAKDVNIIVRIDAPLQFVKGSTRFDISTNVNREPNLAALCKDGSQVLVYDLSGVFVDDSVNGFTARQFTFDVIGSAPASAAFVRAQGSTDIDFTADCSLVPSDASAEFSVANS